MAFKRQIGSEFWDIPIKKEKSMTFPDNTRWFISGTAALEYIIWDILHNYQIKSVAIPSWCCNCMIIPFIKNGICVKFYPVYMDDGKLVCNYVGTEADCWILLNYFGYGSQISIGCPSGILIQDVTHSMFSSISVNADYYFGSLRKWAGFYTGGFAWSVNDWHIDFNIPNCDQVYLFNRREGMKLKRSYIMGLTDSKDYLKLFSEGEEFLDQCEPMKAFEMDIEKAYHIDYTALKEQRQKNALVLLRELETVAMFPSIEEQDCPMFVPILLENNKRNILRDYLKSKNIFCPIHWPIEKEQKLSEKTRKLYMTELSIVCDQRYDEKDMEYILDVIEKSKIIDSV